ncbi:MAG: glucose-1-phosphate thymidylyltransferase [Myxococcales bacterium]|nr:glucose-1-phosphate thymidylyltransferase [Myxococcales bacterium]
MASTLKGLILSGGHGTRLRPLTYTSAKQLIPIANKPVLFYGIEALREAGITEIGIVVGHTRDEIEAAVGDGSRFGVRVTYIAQDAPRGLAHAVMIAEDFIGDSPFVMYLGDNFIIDGVTPIVEKFNARQSEAMILLARVANPQQFGVAVLEGEIIRELVEKPKVPPSDLGIIGVYVFTKSIFTACKSIKPSWRGELEITDAIQKLITDGRDVRAEIVTGYWKDTGRPEDLLDANRMVLDRVAHQIEGDVDAESRVEFRVKIERGAIVRRSVIRGPVMVAAGAVIEDAYIGPFTSVGENCVVRSSEVEHSILLANSRVLSLQGRVVDSVLGRGASVERGDERPRAMRFVLGDNSQVKA